MKKLLIPILLFFPLMAMSQREIKVDSVGKTIGRTTEVFHNDTCYLYRCRGLGFPQVKAGMTATVMDPDKRIKHYWIKLNK